MTHYTDQFNSVSPELATISSLEREWTLEGWRGTHQLIGIVYSN